MTECASAQVGGSNFSSKSKHHALRDFLSAPLILLKDYWQVRLEIDQFHTRTIICEEIDPSLPSLKERIGCIEGEVMSGAEMISAPLPSCLDHSALIFGGIHVEVGTHVIERYNRQGSGDFESATCPYLNLVNPT